MNKVILVDGNNLLFRSYYATAYNGVIMKNSKGFPTNALYGFINMMNKIIEEENPNYIMVAFDKGKTFRHDKYDSYKAGRQEMPDELRLQFPEAKKVLDAMGIYYYEIENYEADDIIGTLAREVDIADDFIATIISSDKDLLQLISDDVDVKLLKQSGFIRMNRDEFFKTYQVEPIRMIDLKALMGDASDHIPGVKGIGEKTAIQLLSKYDNLDNLYRHLDEIKGKTKEKLEVDKENAYMSYDLATIYREVPIDFKLEDLKYHGMNRRKFIEKLEEYEFQSLLRKLNVREEEKVEKKQIEVPILSIDELDTNHDFSFYIEVQGTNYSKSELLAIGFYDGKNGYFINKEKLFQCQNILNSMSEKYTYDLKKSIVVLDNYGVSLNHVSYDMMIAAYLLDYVVKDDISFVAKTLDYEIPSYEDSYGTDKRPKEIDERSLGKLVVEKARIIYETKERLLTELSENEEGELFYEIEMPLAEVLADMEITGIKVNSTYLENIAEELKEKIDLLAEDIFRDAKEKFNILSPKQLAEILFVKLELPYPKKVKNNSYSTNKEILDKLVDYHPIVGKVLEYRTLAKLYTNYAVGLKDEIREDGRIHTVFNQTLTRTGRLSSVSPNLQNIPARDEYAKMIRKAFVADEKSYLLSSDYSQVELRIFASLSDASNLIDAFNHGVDIHTKTAADIFHIGIEEVTKDKRRAAKAVNFGILYGISSFGLSEDLNIDFKQAKQFIDNYLDTYPGIREYMEKEKENAYEKGYVRTIMNRKRVIEELKNKNYMIRSAGERMALNTPIQGSAADILKKAMVEIFQEFKKRNLKSKMLIQVHDELVFNVLEDELEEVRTIVKDIMENVVKLQVPLSVEIEIGKDWYETK